MIERLHGRDGFARLRREGTRFRSGVVWCVMVSDPSLDGPQVAFAIGRTAGTAVKRNRVRRQLREVLRKQSPDLGPGLYLVGLTRPGRYFVLGCLAISDRLADQMVGPKLMPL